MNWRANFKRHRNSTVGRVAPLAERVDRKVLDAIYSRSLVYNTCWEDPALDRQALALRPDDFHVSPDRQGPLARALWTRWFAHDGVRPYWVYVARRSAGRDPG